MAQPCSKKLPCRMSQACSAIEPPSEPTATDLDCLR